MNHIKNIIALITIFSVVVISSCGEKHSEGDGHNHGAEETMHSDDDGHDHGAEKNSHSEGDGHNHGGEKHHEEGLHLSKAQIQTIGIEFGGFSSVKVNDFIKATGKLGLPSSAYSSVSIKTNGIINSSKKFVEGDYVNKGTVIAYLENVDLILIQQNYLEAKAQLNLKQLEVERQQKLIESNAGVNKNLQIAIAEVEVLTANTEGLAKQLAYLNISTSNLSPSTIKEKIPITAPMSGYISKINFHNGMYAITSNSIMEIISSDQLHLELDVFEKDFSSVKVGQKISFSIPALGNKLYSGEVSVIEKEFKSSLKTVRIYGLINDEDPSFIKGLFVNSKIWLSDTKLNAVPEDAIIKDGKETFLYVAKKEEKETEFIKIRVITDATDSGFTAVKLIDSIPDGMQIVTKGAYYVYAQAKAGELKHEH